MNHLLSIVLLLVAATFFGASSWAQEKFEKESRLKSDEVPSEAQAFIDSLGVESKIKWYAEEGLNQSSIEAKFEFQNQEYSVEFDTSGVLEDIEILMDWEELEQSLKDQINAQLEKECEKFNIRKVQIQYSGNPSNLLIKIRTGEAKKVEVRYELIVKCRDENDVALFEYLFNDQGIQLSRSRIVFKNSSNLEY